MGFCIVSKTVNFDVSIVVLTDKEKGKMIPGYMYLILENGFALTVQKPQCLDLKETSARTI